MADGSPSMARAEAKGIPFDIATDTELYLDMTLREIAEEWCVKDPVDLLVVLAEAEESNPKRWATGVKFTPTKEE